MAPARQVIGDSDDDEDYESPTDPLPDQADEAAYERPIESGSTDPSFFRSVYEEQHRDDLRRPTADGQPAPDMWEVPSSPQRPPSRPSTKRKRVDDSAPDASNEATAHATEQRFQIVIDLGGREQDGAETGAEPAGTYPPSTALTESTIAYPTPSRYADQMPDQGLDRLPDRQATPPRQRREVVLPSSPDEIAEPAPFGQASLYGDSSEPPPRSAARNKRRGSDVDELAPDLKRQGARQEASLVCIDSTDDEESMPIMPAIEEAPPKKKRGRKPKAKPEMAESAESSNAPEALPADKPKRPRGRPKRQSAPAGEAVLVEEAVPVEEAPPLKEPAEAGNEPPDTTGDEPRSPDREAAQDSCPPSRTEEQPAPPPDPGPPSTTKVAVAAAKKPASAIGSSQGRVPFRVGLSKKYRIAPLLKTVPKQ